MDESRPQPRRDRPVFVDLIIIGAAIAALMYGGLHLLGKTRQAWDDRYGDTPTSARVNAPPTPAARQWTAEDDAEYFRLKAQAERRRRQYEAQQKNTRCIDGTLFRVEGNSYTSIGRC